MTLGYKVDYMISYRLGIKIKLSVGLVKGLGADNALTLERKKDFDTFPETKMTKVDYP